MNATGRARVRLRVARGRRAQQAALDRWLAATAGAPRAAIAEGAFAELAAPPEVRVERLAAGCVCCIGQVPLRVTLVRVLRLQRPRELLLLVAADEHLPRVRELLAGFTGIDLREDDDMDAPLQRVRANGIDIAFRIDGDRDADRPWLVLAHSLAADHAMWAPQAAAFAGRFRVLRYDLRGHGASSVPAGDYPLELLAGDLLALLDTLAIARCHLVGLSLGGMVVQAAALRAPSRFLSLTLADTTSRQPPEADALWRERIATVRAQGMGALVQSTLERWFTPAFHARDAATVARIGAQIRSTPVDGYVGCAHAVATIDLTARLPAIGCPVLVVVGAEDKGTPPSMARTIAQAIRGARLVEIPQAAHLSNLEQAAAFNAALADHLNGVPDPQSNAG